MSSKWKRRLERRLKMMKNKCLLCGGSAYHYPYTSQSRSHCLTVYCALHCCNCSRLVEAIVLCSMGGCIRVRCCATYATFAGTGAVVCSELFAVQHVLKIVITLGPFECSELQQRWTVNTRQIAHPTYIIAVLAALHNCSNCKHDQRLYSHSS